MSEKIQKVLARAGLGSRREIETWIDAGRVSVNRKIATLGDRVSGNELMQVDGRTIRLQVCPDVPEVIVYHKDIGTICSRADTEGRATVFADFPKVRNTRWILVGRLDFNTSGLLLATTDGDLAHRLMHPSYEIEREYAVRIYGDVTVSMLNILQKGITLDDGEARFEKIKDIGGEGQNRWFNVVLKEGKNREVRRLWESQGVQVNRLSRNRFGPISLPRRIKRGQYQALTRIEMEKLYKLVALPSPFAAEKRTSTKSFSRVRRKKRT
ncbi:MAG: pseudouridine synthase [Gammaproteobacteria bacterium]|nr:pseudouridine synthase [Gammaproteobacteria bacterium]